jgi:hypothetical protein
VRTLFPLTNKSQSTVQGGGKRRFPVMCRGSTGGRQEESREHRE